MGGSVQLKRFDPFDGALGFSFATKVGDLVYTAGCVGIDAATLEVPDDLEAEARLAFEMASGCLAAFGTTLVDVIDMTTFIAGDMATTYPAFQRVRAELMAGHLPTSASVGVTELVDPRLHYEIKMVAAVGDRVAD
jgi:enamine deaminase RidA (YjgF/YER057c/UK114 family)